MYHLKCMYNASDKAFDAFTKLFKRVLPKDSVLPNSFKQMQSINKQFDLVYKKIDACPNGCILLWKDKAELINCPECNASRYKLTNDGTIMKSVSGNPVSIKILCHFPLIPRLKTSEPFVIAFQAIQVFYVPESKEKRWHVVIATKPRYLYELEDDVIPKVEVLPVDNSTLINAEEFIDVREDIMGVPSNEPFDDAIERNNDVKIDSNNSSAESDEDD